MHKNTLQPHVQDDTKSLAKVRKGIQTIKENAKNVSKVVDENGPFFPMTNLLNEVAMTIMTIMTIKMGTHDYWYI